MSCEFCSEKPIYLNRFDYGGLVWKSLEPRFCPMCGEPLTEPEPLTLDELREMDGEPVYMVFSGDSEYRGWAFVNSTIDSFEDTEGLYPFALLGEHLSAYRTARG